MNSTADAATAPAPPQTLDELRELLAAISAGRGAVRLGRRTVEVLAGMVAAPRQSAVFTISELAASFSVNPSTLTRLAKALGYRGFSDFQSVFRRHVAQTGHFYSEQASQLRVGDGARMPELDVFSRIARDERANTQAMLNNLDVATVREVRGLFARAGRVGVLGLRQSQPLAGFFAYGLGMLREDVAQLGGQHGTAHGLAALRPSDVLLVIGFAPYTRTSVTAARVARARSIPVVVVTDSYASPLAASATQAFVTPASGHFFSNSMAAAVILLEALLTVIAQDLGDRALTALKEREALIAEMGIEH